MSSPSPPPPRSQKPSQTFEFTALKWSTKSPRVHGAPKSSALTSTKQQSMIGNSTVGSEKSASPGSSSLRFKIQVSGNTTLECGSTVGSGDKGKNKIVENKQVDYDLKKLSAIFEKNSSFYVNDGDKQEKKTEKMKNDEKALKKYVSSNKKNLQRVKEDPPVVVLDDDDDDDDVDMNAKLWSFRTRKPSQNSHGLNLEKDVESLVEDLEKPILENKEDKDFKGTGKSKKESAAASAKKKKAQNKKKKQQDKKNKEKEAKKEEEEIQNMIPKFSAQLTPEEIAEDIFKMTGNWPKRKPMKRTNSIQREVDQLTPGLWLGSIDAKRYLVNKNAGKGKK